jgi:hypothetical protein
MYRPSVCSLLSSSIGDSNLMAVGSVAKSSGFGQQTGALLNPIVVGSPEPVWIRVCARTGSKSLNCSDLVVMSTLSAGKWGLRVYYPLANMVAFASLVGYLGHFDVFPARLLSWLRRKPLVFDAFVSLYDTSVEDQKYSGAAASV